jgi:hypothetical protein
LRHVRRPFVPPRAWAVRLITTALWVGTLATPVIADGLSCFGDCNGDQRVTIDEIIKGINIALGTAALISCPNFQCCPDPCESEGVDCVIRAINKALYGCEPPQCGNGVTEPNEECDDGGTCIGGGNAGTDCTEDSQCTGDGVCSGGVHAGMSCAGDAQCGSGQCVHCKTFGGDGCAANCTREADMPFQLVPGSIVGNDIAPGTSGIVIHGDILIIPLPLTSGFTLAVGQDRGDGQIPLVMRAGSFRPPRIHPSTLGACICVRDVAAKTCGGTFLEPDGTPSPDCTFDETRCAGRNPCTFLHGAGNAGDGVVDCQGHVLEGIDVASTEDSGGSHEPGGTAVIARSGTGDAGSASLLQSLTLVNGFGFCSIVDPAQFGPDGHFCTDDDPPSTRGMVITAPLVTGNATAQVFNANGIDGNDIGPFSVTGSPFQCTALRSGSAAGACLASAFNLFDDATIGDQVETATLCASP